MVKIKLTENKLKKIIAESLINILNEASWDWRTYDSAAKKALEKANQASNDSDYNEFNRRYNQYDTFRKAAMDAYSSNYNLNAYDNETQGFGDYDEYSSIKRREDEDNLKKQIRNKEHELTQKFKRSLPELYKLSSEYSDVYSEVVELEKLKRRLNKTYRNATQGEYRQASRRTNDFRKYNSGEQEYRNGKWRNKGQLDRDEITQTQQPTISNNQDTISNNQDTMEPQNNKAGWLNTLKNKFTRK